MVNIDADHRLEHILHTGDTIRAGDYLYTITGDPIGFGGSSVLYPARRSGSELLCAIKECFPGTPANSFTRMNGIIRPKSPEDAEAVGALMHFRDRMETERIIGQSIRNTNARAIGIWETLEPSAITADGKEYTDVADGIFAVLERMDTKGMTFRQLLEEIAQPKTKDHPLRTGGLPNIYTTACMMEQVLLALQRVHKAGYLFGDIQDGNVFFSDCHPEAGDIGIGNLLDFGCARELIDGSRTAPITDPCFTTRGFIPPEILDPNKNDGSLTLGPEADIYSVGCLMLRCLISRFKICAMGDSPVIGSNTIDGQEARRLGCPENIRKNLNSILKQAMAIEPENRYPSAEAMLEDIRTLKRATRLPEYLLPPAPGSSESFVEHSRDREIEELTHALEQNEPVFLWGLGGIGKTETAIQVAKNWNSPKGAYFVHYSIPNDDNWESIEETVLQMPFSDYHFDPKKKGLSREQLRAHEYRERMDILRRDYTGALLIIDNFDYPGKTLDDLRAENSFREITNMGIKILFTTRYPLDWAPQWEIRELKGDDLLKLMRRYCTDPAVPDEQLQQLIAAVNGHTLTVELIAKTLSRSRRNISPEQMLESLRSSNLSGINGPDVRSDQNREIRMAQIHDHLRSLFNLSGLDEEAKKILCCSTLLPEDGMDCVLFEDSLENRPEKTMTYILDCGWLRNSSDNLLTIHPVIREVCREELEPDKETCGVFLENLWNQHDGEYYNPPRVLQLAECFTNATVFSVHTYHFNAAMLYMWLFRYDEALKYFQQSIEILQREQPVNVSNLAEAYSNIGICYNALYAHEKARESYELAMEMKRSIPSLEPQKMAHIYSNLAATYIALLDYEKALEYLTTALKIQESDPDVKPSSLSSLYFNLGATYRCLRDIEKALEYFVKALNIQKNILPDHHPELASIYQNIGATYHLAGDYQKALEYWELTLRIQKASLPENHPDLASSYTNLGILYQDLRNHQRALEYNKRALEIGKAVFPEGYPLLMGFYHNVSSSYLQLGEPQKALSYAESVLLIAEQNYSEDNPHLGESYRWLGSVYIDLEDYNVALEYLTKALRIFEKDVDVCRQNLIHTYNAIARIFQILKAYDIMHNFLQKAEALSGPPPELPEDWYDERYQPMEQNAPEAQPSPEEKPKKVPFWKRLFRKST